MSSYSFRKNTVFAVLGGVSNGVLGIARGFVLAHLLGPEKFGDWNIIQLMMAYGAFSGLGLTVSTPILMTQQLTQGEQEAQQRSGVTGFWALFGSSVITGVGLVLWSYAQPGTPVARYAGLIALAIISQQALSGMITLLRGDLRFGRIAAGQSAMALLSVLAVLLLVPRGGVRAAAWAMILSNFIASLVCWLPMAPWPWRRFDRSRAYGLLKESWPIMASNLCSTALQNVDRAIVGLLLGSLALAYYGFASTFAAPLLLAPTILGGAAITHFSRGQVSDHPEVQQRDLLRLTLGIAGAMAFFLGFLLALSGPLVERFFPKYQIALPCLEILLVGSVFYGISSVQSTFMVVHSSRVLLMNIQIAVLVIFAILCGLAVRLGWGYVGVAWANCAIYLTYLIALILMTARVERWRASYSAKLLLAGVGPIAYMEGVLSLLRKVLEGHARPGQSMALALLAPMGAFLLAAIPLMGFLWQAYRQSKSASRIPHGA